MAKNFIAPVRMESQYLQTDLHTVIFQAAAANAPVADGTVAVLGAFTKDPVYLSAFTSAGAAGSAPIDINTRIATAPAAATAVGVGVIDLASVPTATGASGDYRIGTKTIGLTAAAGVPTRLRKLAKDDTFVTSLDNCTGALTVNQFAVLATGANAGKWAPAAVAPAGGGAYCTVVNSYIISQGVDGTVANDGVQAYTLLVMDN